MHKNTYATVTTLSAIAISAVLLTSFTMVGMQFSQHAVAQQMANNTSAPPSANATSAPPSTTNMTSAPSANATSAPSANATSAFSANTTEEPTSGQSFVWQGTASSQHDPLKGHGKEFVAVILKPRSDNGVYSGVLTYAASRGANVEIWHAFSANATKIPKSFGVMKTASINGMPIALTDISPSGSSGSVPFSGNAVVLHATSPFTVTYTVNAVAQPAKTVNNMQTAMAVSTKTPSTSGEELKTKSSSSKGKSSSSGGY
jgi:hypothetical protein